MGPRHHNQLYEDFINSKEWGIIRGKLFNIRGKKCEMCGNEDDIQVHHVSYKRFGGNELMSDLCVLCKPCHMEIHGISGKRKAKNRKNQPYYRRIAIRELGVKRSGGKGWVSLAKLIAEKKGKSTRFSGKDYSKRYVELMLKEFI